MGDPNDLLPSVDAPSKDGQKARGRAGKSKTKSKSKGMSPLGWVLTATSVGALIIGAGLWGLKTEVAEFLAETWLSSQGAPGRVVFRGVSLEHASAQIDLGALKIDQADVEYRIDPLNLKGKGMFQVLAVRLYRPQLKVFQRKDRWSLGRLDGLVLALTPRSKTKGPLPSLEVSQGAVDLSSDYGRLYVTGGFKLSEGTLRWAKFKIGPADLADPSSTSALAAREGTEGSVKGPAWSMHLNEALVSVVSERGRLTGTGVARFDYAGQSGILPQLNGGVLRLRADLPLPEGIWSHPERLFLGDGRATAQLEAEQASGRTSQATGLKADFHWAGHFGRLETAKERPFGFDGHSELSFEVDQLQRHLPGSDVPQFHVRDVMGRIVLDRLTGQLVQDDLRLEGQGQGQARMGGFGLDQTTLSSTGLDLHTVNFTLADQKARLWGQGDAKLLRLTHGDMSVDQAHFTGSFEGGLQEEQAYFTTHGALNAAQMGYRLEDAKPSDGPGHRALKAALGNIALDAPALQATIQSGRGLMLHFDRPAALKFAEGGEGSVSGQVVLVADGPLVPPHGHKVLKTTVKAEKTTGLGTQNLFLDLAPKGLPALKLALRPPEARGDFATLEAQAKGQYETLEGLDLHVVSRLILSDRRGLMLLPLSRSAQCGDLYLERLRAGQSVIRALKTRLCPASGGDVIGGIEPWLSLKAGDLRLATTLRDAHAIVSPDGAEVRLPEAALVLTRSEARPLSGRLVTTYAQVLPLQNPGPGDHKAPIAALALSGSVDLRPDGEIKGQFQVAPDRGARARVPVGQLEVVHSLLSAQGSLRFDAPKLAFQGGGLLPHDLTPLLDSYVKGDVLGSANLHAGLKWKPQSPMQSEAVIGFQNLNFQSSAGEVVGASGSMTFTSVSPLNSKGRQTVTVQSLGGANGAKDLRLGFTVHENLIALESGDFAYEGGQVHLEPFEGPLVPGAAVTGALVFENINLGTLIARSPLKDDVQFTGRVSGRLPFVLADGRVHFQKGSLRSVSQGHLSIRKRALQKMAANGVAGSGQDTWSDLAYQAMEHMDYDGLTAEVNSLPGGRLGMLFKLNGHHAPPEVKKAKISLFDVMGQKVFNKPLQLPSGTGVNLTLDTSLNFDQLVQDLMVVQAARGTRTAPAASAGAQNPTKAAPLPAPSGAGRSGSGGRK